ncbi:hypothetical protein ACWFR1_11720 [Streptomyces sp. NPDC055103]
MTQPDTTAPEQQPVELPPFSGDETECAMCSNLEAFTAYKPAIAHVILEYNGRLQRRGPLPERLERRCHRCDFQWDEALNPTPGVHPATVGEIAYALEQSHAGWALDLSPECARYMAQRLTEMLHLLVRLDHPMWLPRPGRPLLVLPDAPVEPDPAAVAIVMTDRADAPGAVPIVWSEQPHPPAGPTGFTKAV